MTNEDKFEIYRDFGQSINAKRDHRIICKTPIAGNSKRPKINLITSCDIKPRSKMRQIKPI